MIFDIHTCPIVETSIGIHLTKIEKFTDRKASLLFKNHIKAFNLQNAVWKYPLNFEYPLWRHLSWTILPLRPISSLSTTTLVSTKNVLQRTITNIAIYVREHAAVFFFLRRILLNSKLHLLKQLLHWNYFPWLTTIIVNEIYFELIISKSIGLK